jgi:preprotein translocase subunit SecE
MDNQTPTAEDKSASKFDPAEFARETKREISKVTWPTRKETVVTTALIVVMALVAGMFFLAIDSVLGFAISKFLGMRG